MDNNINILIKVYDEHKKNYDKVINSYNELNITEEGLIKEINESNEMLNVVLGLYKESQNYCKSIITNLR